MPPAKPPPGLMMAGPRAPAPTHLTARDIFRNPADVRPTVAASFALPSRPVAKAPPDGRTPQVSDELAAALGKLAAEYAPLPVTTAPFVSAKERELETLERRRRRRVWLLKRGAGALAAIGLGIAVLSFALFRYPSDEALAAEAAKTAQIVLPLYSGREQPLRIDHAETVLSDTFSSRHLRYFAEVTLRLREPLYGPAATNGTLAYRMLQASLLQARDQVTNLNLFPSNDGPQPPDLPQLIQLYHRAGEPLLVRLPFEARKFGWKWILDPPQLAKRTAAGRFDGFPLGHFGDAPNLIFGPPEAMEDFRNRTAAARDYLTAVAKAVQLRGAGDNAEGPPNADSASPASADSEAISAPATPTPLDPGRPVANPNLITVPGLRQPFDPDKPAVAPEKPAKPQ